MSHDFSQLKCNGDREGCQRCLSHDLECSYSESSRRKGRKNSKRVDTVSAAAQHSRLPDKAAKDSEAGRVGGSMNTNNQPHGWTDVSLDETRAASFEIHDSSDTIEASLLDFDERPLHSAGQEQGLVGSGPDLEGLTAMNDIFQRSSEVPWLLYSPASEEPSQVGTGNQPEVYSSSDRANGDSDDMSDLS